MKPETAEGVGIRPPMTKRAAEGLYGMPRLARIESWHPFVLGRSDLATAANKAAAGARRGRGWR